MSSTNRGRPRMDQDFYRTPEWCVRALVRNWSLPQASYILDPCAGDGAILSELAGLGFGRLHGIELHEDRATKAAESFTVEQGDFLGKGTPTGLFDVVVMNPPYSQAEEFVRESLRIAKGNVFALLRLSFMASQKRNHWLRHDGPKAIYVMPKRPSFTGHGSDSCDYAWFHWEVTPRPETRTVLLPMEDCQ